MMGMDEQIWGKAVIRANDNELTIDPVSLRLNYNELTDNADKNRKKRKRKEITRSRKKAINRHNKLLKLSRLKSMQSDILNLCKGSGVKIG